MGHSSHVLTVVFSPNGEYLASGSRDKTIIVWWASNKQLIKTLTGHCAEVLSVKFSTNSDYLATGSWD